MAKKKNKPNPISDALGGGRYSVPKFGKQPGGFRKAYAGAQRVQTPKLEKRITALTTQVRANKATEGFDPDQLKAMHVRLAGMRLALTHNLLGGQFGGLAGTPEQRAQRLRTTLGDQFGSLYAKNKGLSAKNAVNVGPMTQVPKKKKPRRYGF